MRIKKLRLVLPPRHAGNAAAAAREIAERLVDHSFEGRQGLAEFQGPVRLTDHGQTAAQFGLEAGQAILRGKTSGGRS